jgi:hypothetical protein
MRLVDSVSRRTEVWYREADVMMRAFVAVRNGDYRAAGLLWGKVKDLNAFKRPFGVNYAEIVRVCANQERWHNGITRAVGEKKLKDFRKRAERENFKKLGNYDGA